MKRIENNQLFVFLFIILFTFPKLLFSQVSCSAFQTAPPNNSDGSGDAWYPYQDNQSTIVNIYGYGTSTNNFINLVLHFGARQWKLNYLHVQRYTIVYLGTNEGPDFTLPIDENTKTDQGNQINFILDCDLRTCRAFGNHQCSFDRLMSPYGHILVNIEIPDWDRTQWVTSICQGEKPIDISKYLINTLNAKFGGQILNARYYVDGIKLSGTNFDPSLFSPGNHIITARKTYCNSDSGWGHDGDYISQPYTITVTAPTIQFPVENAFLCTNGSPYTLLANPTGGTWIDINNAENKALSGNVFDPTISGSGNYTLRYTYVDPSTNCTGFKDFPIVVNQAPNIVAGPDLNILYNSSPFLLSGDNPQNGIYSGNGVINNIFYPQQCVICENSISYTIKDPSTLCTSTINRNINIIPIIGQDISICNNGPSYNLLSDVNPKGGVFSGTGVEGNNFNPQNLVPGDYTITYSVTNSFGCKASNTRIFSVFTSPETPSILGNVPGCNGSILTLQASNGNSNTNKYQWYKEGDSIPFFIGNNLNYTINGNETLICRATNGLGCSSNPNALINIVSNNPTGDFKGNNTDIPFGGLVNFKTSSSGTSFLWDFGDGGTAVKQNPSHYYYSSGNFNVKLLVTSSQGCVTEFLKQSYIKVSSEKENPLIIQQSQGSGFDSSSVGFNIFPSPFKNYIKITCLLSKDQLVNVDLFNLQGHWLNHVVFEGKKGENNFSLNQLGMLGSGVYYLMKINCSELNQTQKILKL